MAIFHKHHLVAFVGLAHIPLKFVVDPSRVVDLELPVVGVEFVSFKLVTPVQLIALRNESRLVIGDIQSWIRLSHEPQSEQRKQK